MATERDRFTFFKSFAEYYRGLPSAESKVEFVDMIMAYAFKGEEPVGDSPAHSVWPLIKPNMDTSFKRSRAGSAKGVAKARFGNTNATKTQQNSNTIAAETQRYIGDRERIGERVSEDAHTQDERKFLDVPEKKVVVAAATSTMGISKRYAEWWYGEMVKMGWQKANGGRVDLTNWRAILMGWWRRATDEERGCGTAAENVSSQMAEEIASKWRRKVGMK